MFSLSFFHSVVLFATINISAKNAFSYIFKTNRFFLHTVWLGMAQNFVGSNNINLLSPCGQFGNYCWTWINTDFHFTDIKYTEWYGPMLDYDVSFHFLYLIFDLSADSTIPIGTRLMGGKDAASPRYVFTKLEVSEPRTLRVTVY